MNRDSYFPPILCTILHLTVTLHILKTLPYQSIENIFILFSAPWCSTVWLYHNLISLLDGCWWSPGLFSMFTIKMSAIIKNFVPLSLPLWKYTCRVNFQKGNCTKRFWIANFDRYCQIAFHKYCTNVYPHQRVSQCCQLLHNILKTMVSRYPRIRRTDCTEDMHCSG